MAILSKSNLIRQIAKYIFNITLKMVAKARYLKKPYLMLVMEKVSRYGKTNKTISKQ